MNRSLFAFPQQAVALTVSPVDGWQEAGGFRWRRAVLWQLAAAVLCAGLLLARAGQLEASNRAFARSGASLVIGLALAVQLAAWLAYVFIAAGVAYAVDRLRRPGAPRRDALGVVSCSTFPLVLGWVLAVAIAWLRPASGVADAETFPAVIVGMWAAVTVQADLGALGLAASGAGGALVRALGLFWIWHGVTLWGGLRSSLGFSRKAAASVLLALLVVVLVGELGAGAAGTHWHDVVHWRD